MPVVHDSRKSFYGCRTNQDLSLKANKKNFFHKYEYAKYLLMHIKAIKPSHVARFVFLMAIMMFLFLLFTLKIEAEHFE